MMYINIRESLSREKNSARSSSEAKRSSFRFSFFASAEELISASSRAITTTGIGTADFAVLGLKTSVFNNTKSFGTDVFAFNASDQVAGEVVA